MATKDYYALLGLKKWASDADIKKAYKKMAMQYHPDRNKGDKKAETKFKEINEAYQVLGDTTKKKNYDQFGNADFSGFGWGAGTGGTNPFGGWTSGGAQGFDFGDIFSQFGGAGSRRGQSQDFDFDIGDLFGGMGGTQGRSRRNPEPEYHEEPKKPDNLDITETIEIPFLDFLFDTSIDVKTVYGKHLSLKVKAGTKPGTKFKISGKWRTMEGKTGDMYVIVDAKMPKVPLDAHTEKMIEAIRYQI